MKGGYRGDNILPSSNIDKSTRGDGVDVAPARGQGFEARFRGFVDGSTGTEDTAEGQKLLGECGSLSRRGKRQAQWGRGRKNLGGHFVICGIYLLILEGEELSRWGMGLRGSIYTNYLAKGEGRGVLCNQEGSSLFRMSCSSGDDHVLVIC